MQQLSKTFFSAHPATRAVRCLSLFPSVPGAAYNRNAFPRKRLSVQRAALTRSARSAWSASFVRSSFLDNHAQRVQDALTALEVPPQVFALLLSLCFLDVWTLVLYFYRLLVFCPSHPVPSLHALLFDPPTHSATQATTCHRCVVLGDRCVVLGTELKALRMKGEEHERMVAGLERENGL